MGIHSGLWFSGVKNLTFFATSLNRTRALQKAWFSRAIKVLMVLNGGKARGAPPGGFMERAPQAPSAPAVQHKQHLPAFTLTLGQDLRT